MLHQKNSSNLKFAPVQRLTSGTESRMETNPSASGTYKQASGTVYPSSHSRADDSGWQTIFSQFKVVLLPWSINWSTNSTDLIPRACVTMWRVSAGWECSPNTLTPEHKVPLPDTLPPLLNTVFFIETSYFGVYHQSLRNVLQRIQYSICSEKRLRQTDSPRKTNSQFSYRLKQITISVKCRVCPKELPYWRLMPDVPLGQFPSTASISWWSLNLSSLS